MEHIVNILITHHHPSSYFWQLICRENFYFLNNVCSHEILLKSSILRRISLLPIIKNKNIFWLYDKQIVDFPSFKG